MKKRSLSIALAAAFTLAVAPCAIAVEYHHGKDAVMENLGLHPISSGRTAHGQGPRTVTLFRMLYLPHSQQEERACVFRIRLRRQIT